jgi:hypothetical protein
MELSKLNTRAQHEQGAEIQIKCPVTGELTDFYITIVGPDSKEWRRSNKADLRQALSRKRDEPWSDDELLERDVEKLTAITIDWRGLVDQGKEVPFTKEACSRLYEDSPRVMDQVDVFAADYSNFTKG